MSELTKLIVNLVPAAAEALDRAADLTGDTKTDTVNRALQVYAMVLDASQKPTPQTVRWEPGSTGVGGAAVLVLPPDGAPS